MPFDGIVAKKIYVDLADMLIGGRIEKIFQPYKDEIIIGIRAKGQNIKLLISANAGSARLHITNMQKDNPLTPPVFCMLLRKYIGNGKIIQVEFDDYERIFTFIIESLTDLKDIATRKLVVEIMGKHSNIILLNSQNKIIDAIFHIDKNTSSIREIMPARDYIPPPRQNKQNPENIDFDAFFDLMGNTDEALEKFILNNIKGFSPLLAKEICHRSRIEPKTLVSGITKDAKEQLKKTLSSISYSISTNNFTPCIFFSNDNLSKPLDFHVLEITQSANTKLYPSISHALDLFYSSKENINKYSQKKNELIKIISKNISRIVKKQTIYKNKLEDALSMHKFKLFGELITANIYQIKENVKKISLHNYYSENNEIVEIPLDENLSPQKNAQNYFKKYNKAKSSELHAQKQLNEALNELKYLESVLEHLENSILDREIDEIRQELIEEGYISQNSKKSSKNNKAAKKNGQLSSPEKFISSDGVEMLVGKNNKQNDHLTLKLASSNDIWLHTKDLPGAHVIIRKQGKNITENTLLEAAMLAAFFSKGKLSSNVSVDYTTVKNVKKPSGAKPGMVIYNNFKTMVVTPDEGMIKKLRKE